MKVLKRTCLLILLNLPLVLTGCLTLGTSHEDDDGIKGRVVDALTGRGLGGARLTGYLPGNYDKTFKTKPDGSYCFHYKMHPGGVKVTHKGYKTVLIKVSRFARMDTIELQRDPRRGTGSKWDEDEYTPFERNIIDRIKK